MRLRNKGTTLLELTLTVGLLSVVMAMALPAFSSYTHHARANRAIGEISRISMEIYRWRANHGDGSYPVSLAKAGIAAEHDPWGNAYAYLRIADAPRSAIRTDRQRRSLNTDFDLYSLGPDGRTAAALDAETAADDIVRAGDGAYVGVAAQF
ncbi:MAG TPA: hypothetical protein VKQ06_02695 [Gammaproteobacteria bacterium]|nr:hypothetical protein [Gammaproteobacteria bacterium]